MTKLCARAAGIAAVAMALATSSSSGAAGDDALPHLVEREELSAAEKAVTSAAARSDALAARAAVKSLCPDEPKQRYTGTPLGPLEREDALVAQRTTALLRRVAALLASSGHYERSFHVSLCALTSAELPRTGGFLSAQRAILVEMKPVIARWLREDAPDTLRLHRLLGKDSRLVQFHDARRSLVAGELACIEDYLKHDKVTDCLVETEHERVPLSYWALGGTSRYGAGGTSDAIVTTSRMDLGLIPSVEASAGLETLAPRFEKRWEDGAPMRVTSRWLRGIVHLTNGDETAAPSMPTTDIEQHGTSEWFAQLLLVRSRVRRERGQTGDALQDSTGGATATMGVMGLLEHAENLRASGRLREAELRLTSWLEHERRRTRFVGSCVELRAPPDDRTRQKDRERAAASAGFVGALGKQLAAFGADVHYCRATRPEAPIAALARARKDCPDCTEDGRSGLEKLQTTIERFAGALRADPDVATCSKVQEALDATTLLPHENPQAALINDLAVTYYLEGRFDDALRTLTTSCSSGSGDQTVRRLSNSAAALFSMGRVDEAADAISHATLIASHVDAPLRVRVALAANLGKIELSRAKLDDARARFADALRLVGSTDRDLRAEVLDDVGIAEDLAGRHERAAQSYGEALGLREALGQDHPAIATSLSHLATLAWASGEPKKALPMFQRMLALEEEQLVRLLTWGTEASKREALARLSDRVDWLVTYDLAVLRTDEQAKQLAFASIVSRKGRALDAAMQSRGALFERLPPRAKVLFEKLRRTSERSVWLTLQARTTTNDEVRSRGEELARLRSESARLEAEIATELGALDRGAVKGLEGGAAALAQRLVAGQALVEYVVYRPFHPERVTNRFDEPRYAAYVLATDARVERIDIGPAARIDDLVHRFRGALATKGAHEALGDELHALVFEPVSRLLGDARDVQLVADSSLHLLPFDALRRRGQPRGEHAELLEGYRFTMLTSSRDLVAIHDGKTRSGTEVVVFANPDFGEPRPAASGGGTRRRQGGAQPEGLLARAQFTPLPGTSTEALGIARSFPAAKLVLGKDANGAAFKATKSPQILHVATHGFFVAATTSSPAPARARGLELTSFDGGRLTPESPEVSALYRSGLAFAGANHAAEGAIVAGADLAGIDLTGTRLVTLSACESGVGETVSGDGVYGLRRALYLAGSETQVLSLWKVDDDATSELMVKFYTNLRTGMSRGESLRNAKTALASSPRFSHPYYWAAFTLGGSQNKLDGSPPEPVGGAGRAPGVRPVTPGARGCGCAVLGGSGELGDGGWLAAIAASLAMAWWRRRARDAT